MKSKWLSFFIVLYVGSANANLTQTEKNIVQDIRAQRVSQIELLKDLVNIDSGTENVTGVRRVGKKVEALLQESGFDTRWEELPETMQHAGTLIATHRGHQGKKLLLIAHLDTVFKMNSNFKGFTLSEETAKGPGVLDDKGGLVTLIYALQALNKAQVLKDADITVVITGDEEDSGKPTSISRKPLKEAAKNVDVALDFEPALTQNTASTGRRGISNWTLKATGKSSHSAEIFHESVGTGAIFEMSRILNSFRKSFSQNKSITVNPGVLLGGTELTFDSQKASGKSFGKQNVIAGLALAKGDMRFLSSEQKKAMEAKMQYIVSQHLPHTSATLQFEDAIPAMCVTVGNTRLLQQYHHISQDLGFGGVTAIDPIKKGAGDISHVASMVPANLAGLGPWGHGAHTVQETLVINSLTIQTERAALLIYRLLRS